MMFTAALVLGGSIIYAFSASNAGAVMIAAGCAIEVVKFADRVWKWIVKA